MTDYTFAKGSRLTARKQIASAQAKYLATRDPDLKPGARPMNVGAPFRTCQFLHGDAMERDFCGALVHQHSSYCEEHHLACWRTPDNRWIERIWML